MPVTPAYTTEPNIASFVQTFTPSQTAGQDNPPFLPGTILIGTDKSEYMYVLASGAINQYDCVDVDTSGNALQMTNALATSATNTVGFAQVAIPSGSYGWVALVGANLKVNTLTGTAAGVALYTTATAGVLSSTATSQKQIFGVRATSANSSGQTQGTAINADSPRTVS